MVNWNKGLSAETYVAVVDSISWKDTDRMEITGGSISRTDEGLRNAADLDFVNYDQTKERWIRVYLDVRQEGASEHVALFTGLALSPKRDLHGVMSTNSVQCNSVLQPAQDVLLKRGWYAPQGVNAGTIIQDLLSVTPAPVRIDGTTPNLKSSIVAEEGETHLTMVDKVLMAIGWRIRIQGDGVIEVTEDTSTRAMFDALENDSIETELSVEYDWFSAPNVFRAITDTDCVTARDDKEDSPLSTVNRGREIWVEESNCNLNDGESLASYAERRLREEQMVNFNVSYRRRYRPNVYPTDRIELNYPAQNITGIYKIESQNIELGYGASMNEEVVRV